MAALPENLPYDDGIFLSYKLWLLKMASIYLPRQPNEWEDLAQEGHIAMWRAMDAYDPAKGSLPSWLTQAAKLRMREVASRRTWTGTPMIRGHRREKPATPVNFDEIAYEAIANLAFHMRDGVEMAYHHGEVYQAMSGLSDSVRTALYKRFWLDESVGTGFYSRAMPTLEKNLAHLRGTCE